MKIITQINDKIRELYPNCDARNGIAKQIVNGYDGLRVAIFEDNDEPSVFVPDDEYEIQVAHIVKGGSLVANSAFNEYLINIDLVVISKKVKFYHILHLLKELRIEAQSFDLTTRNVLKNILNVFEEYPEQEAFIISYNFTTKAKDLIDLAKQNC